MTKLASALHEATHRVPGVPAHTDAPAGGRHDHTHVGLRNMGARSQHASRQQTPPRVFVAWQNWIGRLVGPKDDD